MSSGASNGQGAKRWQPRWWKGSGFELRENFPTKKWWNMTLMFRKIGTNTWSEGFKLLRGFIDHLFNWWLMWQKVNSCKKPEIYTIYPIAFRSLSWTYQHLTRPNLNWTEPSLTLSKSCMYGDLNFAKSSQWPSQFWARGTSAAGPSATTRVAVQATTGHPSQPSVVWSRPDTGPLRVSS